APGRGRGDPGRLAVSARSRGAGVTAAVVSSAPGGRQQPATGDLWGSDVVVTTSRGFGSTRAMAEHVLAWFVHFAAGLHPAHRDRQGQQSEHGSYGPVLIEGKTVCVGGAGGIGRAVGSLCAGAGMRVVGTRRRVSPGDTLPT